MHPGKPVSCLYFPAWQERGGPQWVAEHLDAGRQGLVVPHVFPDSQVNLAPAAPPCGWELWDLLEVDGAGPGRGPEQGAPPGCSKGALELVLAWLAHQEESMALYHLRLALRDFLVHRCPGQVGWFTSPTCENGANKTTVPE